MKVKSLSQVRLLATPWTAAHHAPPSMDFPGKSTGVGCHCLLRGRRLTNCTCDSACSKAAERTEPCGAPLPVHDHGVQRGLRRLVRAAPEAHAAVALLLLAGRAATLNRVQGRPSGRQRLPRWGSNPNSACVDTDFLFRAKGNRPKMARKCLF